MPPLSRTSYIMAKVLVAAPAAGGAASASSQQANYTIEVACVKTFFSAEPPGSIFSAIPHDFAEAHLLAGGPHNTPGPPGQGQPPHLLFKMQLHRAASAVQ